MIGERLAEVRKDHGDKQADLASKLHVTRFTIRSWEQERSAPSHEMLIQICRLYGVSSDYLLGISDRDPLLEPNRGQIVLSESEEQSLQEYIKYLVWKRDH